MKAEHTDLIYVYKMADLLGYAIEANETKAGIVFNLVVSTEDENNPTVILEKAGIINIEMYLIERSTVYPIATSRGIQHLVLYDIDTRSDGVETAKVIVQGREWITEKGYSVHLPIGKIPEQNIWYLSAYTHEFPLVDKLPYHITELSIQLREF